MAVDNASETRTHLRRTAFRRPDFARALQRSETFRAGRSGPVVHRRRAWRADGSPYLLFVDLAVCVAVLLPRGNALLAVVTTVATIVALAVLKLYRSRLSLSLLDDLPYIVISVVFAALVKLSIQSLTSTPRPSLATEAWTFATLSGFLLLFRGAAFAATRRARRIGQLRDLALVVGAGHVGIRLATILQEHPEYGIDVVGFADRAPRVEDHSQLPAPWLGDYDDIPELIVDYNVRKVIVAFGALQESQLVELLWTCDRLECEIFFVPRLFEMQHTSRDMDNVWGVPLVRFRRAAFRTFSWKLKRVVDLVLGAVALIVFSPILAMCALAVRLEGGRGVLFRQQRVGLDGRPFMMLKFRSLRPASEHEAAVTWNISCDDRLGPVGRFLRRTSLDELPQLWNVVTGKMSLVGPRPERPHFVSEFSAHIPRYTGRHRVPAGLTGWAQVHGLRGDTSIEDRASFDNFYIENWSLWGDFKILVRTIGKVLMRAGG